MTLAIRADANARVGAGHVMRSIALAEAWRRAGGEAILFTVSAPPFICGAAERRGVSVRSHASADATWHALVSWVRPNTDAWVAFDSYELDHVAHRSIRASGAHLLVIDDCAPHAEFDCDILVNQNIGAEDFGYRLDAATRRCL